MRGLVLFNLSWLGLFLLVVMTAPAAAQVSGTISGTIADQSGAVLPGVNVEATNLDTGTKRNDLSGETGRFRLAGLPLGRYEVRASLTGFRTAVAQNLELEINQELVVNLTLQVGEVSQELLVSEGLAAVETTTASISAVIDPQKIRNLPLNGRSFADLAVLEPGVSSFQNATSTDPVATAFGGTGVRLVIQGMRPELNNILVDGIDAVDAFGNAPGSAAGVLLGVDTVREFQVLTSSYGAEFGRAAGGILNVATRSGTNEFHGSLFEFHRNDNLDARNFFDQKKPEFKRNQFGFTLGGPVARNKSFFFGSYEGFRERLGLTNISLVPNAAARTGDLGIAGRVQVNPAVRPFLDLYPLPNGRLLPDGRGEFIFHTNANTDEDFAVIKVDHNFSDSQSMFVRYSFNDAHKKFPALGVLFGPQLYEPHLERDSRQQLVAIEHSAAFGGGKLNVIRIGFNRTVQEEGQFPLKVLPDLGFFRGVNDGIGLINVPGLSTTGGWTADPGHTIQNQYQWSDDFSWTVRNHVLKFGGVVKRFQYNDNRFFQSGAFTFDGFAQFLRGTPGSFIKDAPDTNYTTGVRFSTVGFYIQDNWAAHRKLTLNLGLRHEFMTTPFNALGPVRNFRNPLVESVASIVSTKPIENPGYTNFMPRIGLAWDPFGNQKTSIRAGFGLFFQQLTAANLNFVFRLSQPPVKTILIGGPPAAAAFPKATIPAVFTPTIVFPLEHDAKNPYTAQWNLTIDRELFTEAVLSVSYVGNRGIHLATPTEINFKKRQILPDGRPFFPPGPPVRENPNFSAINLRDFGSDSYHHGLNVGFRKSYRAGFQFQSSYSFSKTIDNSPPAVRDLENSPTILFDWFNRNLDRSISGFDVRHNFIANFSYELPWGPGKAVAGDKQGAAARFLEGWQVNGILKLNTGNPFTVENGFDRTGTAAIGPFRHDRPNLAPGRSSNPKVGSPDRWFDVTAFELQPVGFLGNIGRNTIEGPGLANFDLSLFKTITLSERVSLQLRTEFFNVFNRANFATPQKVNRFAFLGTTRDASGREVGLANPNAGRLTGTITPARQIQFAFKLTF